MTTPYSFDVIIVGGSYSGLSAAMALGRSLRKVLIIDSGQPCNRQTPYSHNFITQDGVPPAKIAEKAKEQVLEYDSIQFTEDRVVSGHNVEDNFFITTSSGKEYQAKKLIFATGVKDLMPNIKGFSECWGISVIHCPYCHGYEFRHKKTAIMAPSEHGFHLASLVHNLTDKLTLLTSGNNDYTAEQMEALSHNNIQLIETPVDEIRHKDGYIERMIFTDGSSIELDTLYAGIPFEQHCDVPITLGCELDEMGYLNVDPFQKTTVNGIYACGDSTTRLRSVATAVNSGLVAGAMVNKELAEEQFLIPVI